MNRLSAVALAVLLAGGAAGCTQHRGFTPIFGVSLAPPTGALTVGGPVVVEVTLTNVSGHSATVNQRLAVNDPAEPVPFRELWFDVRTPSGGSAPFRLDIRIGSPGPNDFGDLAPGAKITRSVDLSEFYDITAAGQYSVTATYENRQPGPNNDAAKGKATSKAVRFTVGS